MRQSIVTGAQASRLPFASEARQTHFALESYRRRTRPSHHVSEQRFTRSLQAGCLYSRSIGELTVHRTSFNIYFDGIGDFTIHSYDNIGFAAPTQGLRQ